MGSGSYSHSDRTLRSASMGYATKDSAEIFTQREIKSEMNPKGIKIREARDSVDHPNSVPIIIGLDCTGSMGAVPHALVKDGLPNMVKQCLERGVADPAILFIGIGDHQCDRAPLQVGQFESSDVMLDHWLTSVFLEGGGGGNGSESYTLAWYFASQHTALDSFEKRGVKGVCVTIGDDSYCPELPASAITRLMGVSEAKTWTAAELLQEAQKTYHVFHIHITHHGDSKHIEGGWRELLGDNLLLVSDARDVAKVIADKVASLATSATPLKTTALVLFTPESQVDAEEIL